MGIVQSFYLFKVAFREAKEMIFKGMILFSLGFLILSCREGGHSFDASGHFEATEVTISSQTSGEIVELNVAEGQKVMEGEILAIVDTVTLSIQKRKIESRIRAVEGQRPNIEKSLAPLKEEIKSQANELDRVTKLVEANAAPAKQLEDLQAHLAILKERLEGELSSLEIADRGILLEVEALKVELEGVEDMISRCFVKSPINGVVIERFVERGETAVAGRALYKVADISSMVLKAYITSDQLSQLKLGDKVKLFSDFGEEQREYSGEVINIATRSEFTPKSIYTKNERPIWSMPLK